MITLLLTTITVARAQTLTVLHTFCTQSGCLDGEYPGGPLIQATHGELYGTTEQGGANGGGTIFKLSPSGRLTTVYSFCSQSNCTDGQYPGALIQATNGNLYGTTIDGGTNNAGTAFTLATGAQETGALTTLHSFCSQPNCTDGVNPGALIQANNGEFYGTTQSGGGAGAFGTVFTLAPRGTLTSPYTFSCSNPDGECKDGITPTGPLLQASTGVIYGTTEARGPNTQGAGSVFEFIPGRTLKTLYSFVRDRGVHYPNGGLIEATDGNLYGTTGGNPELESADVGIVFRLTPSGKMTTLYTFCSQSNCLDGQHPGPLIQASDGNFYGTTNKGGVENLGTIFRMTPDGTLTTLYSFCTSGPECPDGARPYGALLQAADGNFYGTTYGTAGVPGNVFMLNIGLGPFVALAP